MVEYRPACGGGSCARCLGALGLDAVKQDGLWYCASCAEGGAPETEPVEPRLYHRPARYFGRRRPKELRSAG